MELILFGTGFVLGAVWFSTVILPLFYGIPKSIYHVLNGTLKGFAILHYMFVFALWLCAFLGAVVLIATYFPTLDKILYESEPFYAGQLIGTLSATIRALTKSGRVDLGNDFWSTVEKYRRLDHTYR